MSTREVYAGHGHEAAMGYRFRARIEHRIKRGKDQWRWVGEYKHVSWRDSGPGITGWDRGRWTRDRVKAESSANCWLDAKAYDPAAGSEYVSE